ncbi:MAG TPA: DUF4430 domain-containing protein [Atopostipes sp.]|nr:DUF4430 domain-containing protein [Atopostipes sp.]
MEKRKLSKLFLLLSAGVVLGACATETEEAPVEEEETTESTEATEDEAATETETNSEEVTVTFDIVIDGENVADLSQEVTVPEGTYLLDAMHDTYDVVDEGSFITTIEGYEQDADAGRYWLYYINGEMPSVGAADYELESEDQIEWRLEDSEF